MFSILFGVFVAIGGGFLIYLFLHKRIRALKHAIMFVDTLAQGEGEKLDIDGNTAEIDSLISVLNESSAKVYLANKRTEEKHHRTRLFLDSLPVALFAVDMDARLTFLNHSCLDIFNFTDAEDIVGSKISACFHEIENEPFDMSSFVKQVLNTGNEKNISNYKLVNKTGKIIQAAIKISPIIKSDSCIGASVTIIDNASTVHAMKLLRKKSELFKLLLTCKNLMLNAVDSPRLLSEICSAFSDVDDYEQVEIWSRNKGIYSVKCSCPADSQLSRANEFEFKLKLGAVFRTGNTEVLMGNTNSDILPQVLMVPVRRAGNAVEEVFCIYTHDPGFGSEEREKLEALAGELGCTLDTIGGITTERQSPADVESI
jgi:PAS domain S-box-containing protein